MCVNCASTVEVEMTAVAPDVGHSGMFWISSQTCEGTSATFKDSNQETDMKVRSVKPPGAAVCVHISLPHCLLGHLLSPFRLNCGSSSHVTKQKLTVGPNASWDAPPIFHHPLCPLFLVYGPFGSASCQPPAPP